MKQQIISVLAASLFLAGSMVTSSAQAFGAGCYKAYQKNDKKCYSETAPDFKKAKGLEDGKVLEALDAATQKLIKCQEAAVKALLECRLEKGKFIEDIDAKEKAEREILVLTTEFSKCQLTCDDQADVRKAYKDAPDTTESTELWDNCMKDCKEKYDDKKVDIMKKYISTQKEPSKK